MKLLIKNGRVIDPASGLDCVCDVAIAGGRIVSLQGAAHDFEPNKIIDATGCIVAPGLIDLSARLREPGYEHEGMLESELAAAVAGGVTSLVCPPDTDPVLDEPGLVEMLKFRAEKLRLAKPDAIVMHPGPINRGVEIDSAVVDGAQSVILPQVTFGIAVRMAVMSIVAGNEA